MKLFIIHRTANGFTREIELKAASEQEAIQRADALFSHENVEAEYTAKRAR